MTDHRIPRPEDLVGRQVEYQGYTWTVTWDETGDGLALQRPLPPETIAWLPQGLRDGTLVPHDSAAQMAGQAWPTTRVGLEQELAMMEAIVEGARARGDRSEADLELLEDRCAGLRRRLNIQISR